MLLIKCLLIVDHNESILGPSGFGILSRAGLDGGAPGARPPIFFSKNDFLL